MNFLVDNWPLLVAAVAVIVAAASWIHNFIKLPRAEQIAKVKQWLLWAVSEAEKILGGGTGQLKLRYVYDMFVTKFPVVAKLISFTYFGELVDEALEQMRELLDTNEAIEAYINSSEEVTKTDE